MAFENFIKLPKSSRGCQNLQHFISGTMQVLNYSTAGMAGLFAIGKISWYVIVPIGLTAFCLNRLSSEISYQTSKRLFEENKQCHIFV